MPFQKKLFFGLVNLALLFHCEIKALDREKRLSELEKQMLEVAGYNKGGTYGAIFAPNQQASMSGGVSVEALLWQAVAGETDFAYSVESISSEATSFLPMRGRVSSLSFDWSAGFRVGATKENIFQNNELSLTYTRFYTQAKEGGRKDLPQGFLPLTGFLSPTLSANSSYRIYYDDLILEIAKSYFVSPHVLFRSHAGLKGSRIQQKHQSHYEMNVSTDQSLFFSSQLNNRCTFYGIGPQMAFDSRWYLFKEFSLVANGSGSLLYGYYKVKDVYKSDEGISEEGRVVHSEGLVDLQGNFHSFSPFGSLALGVSWNRAFLKEKVIITFSLFYETLYYWRQTKTLIGRGAVFKKEDQTVRQTQTLQFTRNAEDIAFRGASFLLEVDF